MKYLLIVLNAAKLILLAPVYLVMFLTGVQKSKCGFISELRKAGLPERDIREMSRDYTKSFFGLRHLFRFIRSRK